MCFIRYNELSSPFGIIFFVITVFSFLNAEVTLTPSTQNISENTPLILTCSYVGDLTVETYTVIISSRTTLVGSLMADCSVFSKQPDPIMYSYTCPTHEQLLWTIRNVTRAYDGNTWRCLVGFTTIGSEEATYTINVQVPIQTVEMINPMNNVVTIQQNIETVFICRTSEGKPKATVRWYIDKRTATTNDDKEITTFATATETTIGDLIYVTSTLRYSPAKEDNGMKIYCTAINFANNLTSSRQPQLNVQYSPDGPPVIEGFNNTETCYVIENNQSLLSCSSSGGNPLATLSWDCFNSGSTSTSSVESNVTKTVTFTALRGQDRSCTCKSSHPVGRTQSVTVNIEVLYKASIVSFVAQGRVNVSSVTVDENDNVLFVCNIDSNPRSNIEIAFQDKILHRQNMTDTLRYTHTAVTCLESGIYTCTARNQYNFGNDAIATLELHIKCSPRPLHQMKTNFTSVLYDTATLNFTALAYPEPGINGFVWHKQNSFTWIPLLSNTDVIILSSGLHTRLTIKNVSWSDFGHYRVTVTNEIGKYEQYISLTETGQQKTPTETILPSKKTLESTGLIISVTLGILFVTVTIYAISMTIYFKRKLIFLDAQTSTQPSQRTYANLSFQTVNTDEDYSRPSTNDTAAVTNDNEYSVQNYTDLHHLSNDNQRTYDVIQKT